MQSFIIAEAGINHNGSLELALQLVECAAKAGANAVKFQTFKAKKLVRPGTQTAEYQNNQTGINDQFVMLENLELSEADYKIIYEHCHAYNIEFMSTPFDEESTDFLISLGMRRIKIPSGEITNFPFLAYLAKKNLPLILSTGMSSLNEVREAIEHIRAVMNHESSVTIPESLTVLHCTSNYPTLFQDVNLRAMLTLKNTFMLPVGYSDHTSGILVPPVAVALGATVIEKHFTLDRNLPGPDHQASLTPNELTQMVTNVRAVESSLGEGVKEPRASEIPVRDLVRRSLCLQRSMKKGEVILEKDLISLRPANGISPKEIEKVYGRTLIRDLPYAHVLAWTDLQ